MAICKECGARHKMNWVRIPVCKLCRRKEPGGPNQPAPIISRAPVEKRWAKLGNPDTFGYPVASASDGIKVNALEYGYEFSDDSKEWAIVVQLTYNQGGQANWVVTFIECDGGRISPIVGHTDYLDGNPEVEFINNAINRLTVQHNWVNPLNQKEA